MAGNLDATWEWLTDNYKAFRKREKRQSHVAKISGYLMSYGDKTGAVGAWSKGVLTTNWFYQSPTVFKKQALIASRARCLSGITPHPSHHSWLRAGLWSWGAERTKHGDKSPNLQEGRDTISGIKFLSH